MKKLLAVSLCLCFLALSLVACGGGVKASVPDIAAAVETAAAVASPIAIDDDELHYAMGLTAENIAEYAGSHTGVSGSSGTVLVVKAAAGKISEVEKELKSYCATNADFLSNYPEFATAQAQAADGRVVVKGDVAVLAIAAPDIDYAAVDTAIEGALK
ncbi:MAG: DUF4358 domain-containing protein [Ruthenibacterium sp.]